MPHPKKYIVTIEKVEEEEKEKQVEELPVEEIPLEQTGEQPPEQAEDNKVEEPQTLNLE